MIFIGDIHGRFKYYLELIKNMTHTPTIQVGDMGMGFPTYATPDWNGEHYFIRGNHDNPAVCKAHPKYLGEYGYNEKLDVFYAGGADSIDKMWRTEFLTWWRDEQMDYRTFDTKVIPLYEKVRPRVVVTHTCPETVRVKLLEKDFTGWEDVARENGPPVTELALQTMFEVHQPDLWVFGHYHKAWKKRMDGTLFVCVNSMTTFETE